MNGFNWVPILSSKLHKIITLYHNELYLGCIIYCHNELLWKALPYKIGKKSIILCRGSYSEVANELKNWALVNCKINYDEN